MRKRTLYLAMAAMMTAAAIGGCSGSSSDSNSTTEAPAQDSTTAGENTDDTQASDDTETPAESDSQEEDNNSSNLTDVHTSKNGIETKDNGVVRTDLTALELSYLMGNGINLGNTMEAVNASLGYGKDTSFYEKSWGQPVTTQEMITGMKEAGFDTIRIPVAWVSNAMENYADGDYTIAEAELNRVEEIINYALNEEMYVIINDHWDGGWWGMFGSETEETREAAMDLYVSMWTQIAERYAEYGDHLIFESGNEELGSRLNDRDIAADSGSLSEAECYETANKINQTFVDTIRAAGGNNENRFLLIAGYNTNIDMTCDDQFVMPTDTADSKLFVSVHYYDPWSYCGDEKTVMQWGSKKEYENMNASLEQMTKFTDQGYGVIIGEYAVLINGETDDERGNTVDYMSNFLNNCDQYNYVSCLWDCSTLYNRKESSMRFDDTAELFANRSFASQAEEGQEAEITAAQEAIAAAVEAAPISLTGADYDPEDHSKATAWIMWNGTNVTYSVGDEYNPDSTTTGLVAGTTEVTGEGVYTVSLDFTGTEPGNSNGFAFAAAAIYNGEVLYPGYYMVITSCLVNGEEYEFLTDYYTTNDNEFTTRVNLYNEWVKKAPAEARNIYGDLENSTSCIMDKNLVIETLEITFDYVSPDHLEEYVADRNAWAIRELQ